MSEPGLTTCSDRAPNARTPRWLSSSRLPVYAMPVCAVASALFIGNALANHAFVAQANWASAVNGAAVVIILAMAQVAPILSGRAGVDLSVGPIAGIVNAIIVVTLSRNGVTDPVLVIVAALAIGAAAGLINGVLIAVVRLPAIVATLGSYLALSGLTLQIMPQAGGSAPSWLSAASNSIGPFPALLFVIAGIGVAWVLLTRTGYRRNLFGIGSDERAAYAAGVSVTATRLIAYVISGVIAGVGGLILTSVLGSGDPTVAPNYTLQSIAAVALGGIALTGGRGGMLGAALGAAVLFLIQNLLALAHVDIYRLQIVYGLVVLIAVSLNSIVSRRRSSGRAAGPRGAFAGILDKVELGRRWQRVS